MKPFMDKDFLLDTPTAKHLFHDYCENMPICDYHCHLSPKEIYENKAPSDISELWLSGDHYKWRAMRSCGVSEERVAAFEEKYEEVFGKDTALPPKNVIDGTRMHIKTPEVTIRVNPDCQDVLETRVIDGVRYILVRADREVEVNGVNIQI